MRLLLVLALIQLTSIASAQRRFNPEEMAQREKEIVFKKVENLSAMQTELLNGIYNEFAVSMTETFEEIRAARNWKEMRPRMQALREDKDLLVKDVLNSGQFSKYAELTDYEARQKAPQDARQEAPQDKKDGPPE